MSKLATEANVEIIKFRDAVDIPSTTHATFGLYRYPAKFIPHVIEYILENYADPGSTIFDPFGGYGTVGTVAKIHGHDYEMWDLNPMLGILHPIATMKPIRLNIQNIITKMKASRKEFIPEWKRHVNWFEDEFLPFLYRIWGHYHSIQDKKIKMILTIPLLKTTRYFSYDDMQRQKLSRSPISIKRIENLLESDWRKKFFQMLQKDIVRVQNGISEYEMMRPKRNKSKTRTGIDVMSEPLTENKDILITSPPYLMSQEYMRQAKLDLFWLGFSEEKIRNLSRLEIPYRNVEPCVINSPTYEKCLSRLREDHIRKTFQNYFWCIIGTFTRLQKKINSRMFIFVGHSSIRGNIIPIDQILVEHLSRIGWLHEKTLSDKIVSRQLFSYSVNPASKIRDTRTPFENLIILKRT